MSSIRSIKVQLHAVQCFVLDNWHVQAQLLLLSVLQCSAEPLLTLQV